MLDISLATNMLTSMGVSSALAERAAQRTAQSHANADPLTFLKELRATLAELSAGAPPAGTNASTTATSPAATAYQSTADLYSHGPQRASSADTASTSKPAAAVAPFSNLEEFKQWEKGLGDTFAADYDPPDYVRVAAMLLSGGDDTLVSRYMFFKNHPEFAADYESIRSGNLSRFPTDGSTLVKSDLSKMSTEMAAYYRKNPNELLAAEGFNMDPTLAKMRMDGKIEAPTGTNITEWLMSNKWTPDGIVAQSNRIAYANADFIGLDGKGAGTYRLSRFDAASGNIINFDGQLYDPLTGEAKA